MDRHPDWRCSASVLPRADVGKRRLRWASRRRRRSSCVLGVDVAAKRGEDRLDVSFVRWRDRVRACVCTGVGWISFGKPEHAGFKLAYALQRVLVLVAAVAADAGNFVRPAKRRVAREKRHKLCDGALAAEVVVSQGPLHGDRKVAPREVPGVAFCHAKRDEGQPPEHAEDGVASLLDSDPAPATAHRPVADIGTRGP